MDKSKMVEKVIGSKAKVRFQDCDPFNHLNNAKYIDYFMNAREDQMLIYYDFDIDDHFIKTKRNWVVASNQIAYFKPAALNEKVLIKSQLIDFTSSTLLVEMTMWDETGSRLKSVYWGRFVYFDGQALKRVEHSVVLKELFEAIKLPVAEKSFEDRVSQLKRNKSIG